MRANSEKLSIHNETSVVLDSAALHYGISDSFTVVRPYRQLFHGPVGLSQKLKFFVGELTGLVFITLSTFYILAMPVAFARPGELKAAMNRTIKRMVDILGATVGLVLSLPLVLVIALLIKLDSPGPVFYAQVRVGVNRRKRVRRYCQCVGASERRGRDRRRQDYLGKPFQMMKFRTMVHDAEKKTGPIWAAENDPRVTRLGSFLRKTRLDEIPQFWSILKGDMSMVGPRPERPVFVRNLSSRVDNYHRRLEVKPGLTGLAQVENGYDSSISSVVEKVRFDLDYIRGWSLWTDVRILLKTVVVVVTGRGAC